MIPTYLNKKDSFSGINKLLVRSGRVFTRFRIPVLILLISGGVWLSMGINELKVDTNPDHYFPSDSRLRVANSKISDAFGGSTQMQILVEGDIFSPETLHNIEKLTDHIKARHKIVTKSYSIVDVIKKMHAGFNGNNPDYEVIPDDRDLISQYMFLYSITGGEDDFDLILDDMENPTFTQVFLRLKEVQTFAIAEIVETNLFMLISMMNYQWN